ncbi:MAG: serine protease, partial [Opitutae bacterium]|nr:serine protease [Opitutae bacterium]
MKYSSVFKLSIFAVLCSVFGSLALAKEETSEIVEKQDANEILVVSEPDYGVLRRMQTFRGPYTDQDDPRLEKGFKQEFIRTGVDQTKFVCRPPGCKREQGILIVKLASAITAKKMSNVGGVAAPTSDLLNTAKLSPVFGSNLLDRAEAKRQKGRLQTPRNSMGNPVDLTRWYRLALPAGTNLDSAIGELELDPRVEVVEANFERTLKGEASKQKSDLTNSTTSSVVSNDPRKTDQWALTRTRTEEAWQWLDDNGYPAWGDRNIVVAVIDSGVDYTHEDLAGNMWVNAGEVPDDG